MTDEQEPHWGSARDHQRSMVPRLKSDRSRRGCPDCADMGLHVRNTHYGQANGLTLLSGCEWHVRRWVKRGY